MSRAVYFTRFFSRCLSALMLSATLIGGAGCAGYRLGSMLPPGVRTVHVPTVENETGEPLVETEVTRALIARIQTDGTLQIERDTVADAVLQVVLKEYSMGGIAFDRGPGARTNEYRITVLADVSFMNARTGEVISRHAGARGETTVAFAGSAAATSRNALPSVAEDLARDIVRRIVEAW